MTKVIIFLALVLGLGFLGFKYVTSGSPRDLGVNYTDVDYSQTHQKIGTEVSRLESASDVKNSLQYSGQKESKVDLNSSEVTAYLNASKWVYAPASKVQVKINPDGTGEISGLLNIRNLIAYVSLTTPNSDIQKAIDQYHIPNTTTFYAAGTVDVINNKVNLNIKSLEIARIPVPAKYLGENLTAVNNYATDRLNSIPNLMVRNLTLSNSQVHLDATVPAKVAKLEK